MISINALHGFLGKAADWDFLEDKLKGAFLVKEELFCKKPTLEPKAFWQFAENLIEREKKKQLARKPIIMGYSLGGRLGLHALLRGQNFWGGAVIISSHFGLKDEKLKHERLKSDLKLKNLLLSAPWNEFLSVWNSQTVFENTTLLKRNEEDYDKNMLAKNFSLWSLAVQENLKEAIEAVNLPILWIAGAQDKKYAELALSLKLKSKLSSVWIAEESGHRVPWQKCLEFSCQVNEFIERIRGQSCKQS